MMIHGGFAVVFPENDANATIGPIKKPSTGFEDYLRHEMVLRFPKSDLRETSLSPREENGFLAFVLEDEVQLLPDGRPETASRVTRNKTGNPKQGDWDHFYYVWDANRFKDATDDKGVVRDDWREQLLAHLEIRNGRLVVQQPYLTTRYAIERKKAKQKRVDRALATHILYVPNAPADYVTFRTPAGSVTANATRFDLSADCDCPSHEEDPPPINQDLPGFGVTFTMYKAANTDHLEFIPRFLGNPNRQAAVDPGHDCPPREYSI
jgi:hypothetical protein